MLKIDRWLSSLAFAVMLSLTTPSQARADAQPTSTFAFNSSATVSARQCPTVTGETSTWCTLYWPPKQDGKVYLYTFTETRSDGSVLMRTAYVYKPAGIKRGGSYPLMTFLHGGTQSGDEMFEFTNFPQLADGRAIAAQSWYKNTASCQYGPLGSSLYGLGGTSVLGYISTDGSNAPCTPPLASYQSSGAEFYLVFPNGIESYDGNGRNWEDGRTPSPGFADAPNPDEERRDDVGFINALLTQIKTSEGSLIDSSRVYLGGVSNGGIMTHRILCNASNGSDPQIAGIAAFAIAVASMADDIYHGTNGREQCPASGTTLASVALWVGYGTPTPNAPNNGTPYVMNCNPYNPSDPYYPSDPACPWPTVSGDGTIPYGTSGSSFTVNSNTLGQTIASDDDQAFWTPYFTAAGAGTAATSSGSFGYFTSTTRTTFANSPMVYQVSRTLNGLHLNGGTRYDYSYNGRIYDFLFAFRKSGGAVTMTGTYNASTGTYGQLTGTY